MIVVCDSTADKPLLPAIGRKVTNQTPFAVLLRIIQRIAKHPFKETAEHFNRDPVVISKGIKGLEKKIREDETISTAITVLHESLTKNRKKIFI